MYSSTPLTHLSAIGFLLLAGCYGATIPKSDNPEAKLQRAHSLVFSEDRPIPAERMLLDAADIYRERDDQRGLGNAYRQYAEFLRSPSVGRNPYFRNGFANSSVTFDTREGKAVEYLQKALSAYAIAENRLVERGQFDLLSNVYLNVAVAQLQLGNKALACSNYDKSLAAHQRYREQKPSEPLVVPTGYKSFEDVIAVERRRANC